MTVAAESGAKDKYSCPWHPERYVKSFPALSATRRLFGRGVRGAVRGWAIGMVLPVCSLGVIPVARELRRGGVPGGTVLAFVLTAPLLNPISFLYGRMPCAAGRPTRRNANWTG